LVISRAQGFVQIHRVGVGVLDMAHEGFCDGTSGDSTPTRCLGLAHVVRTVLRSCHAWHASLGCGGFLASGGLWDRC
jgi:hypothetical protein